MTDNKGTWKHRGRQRNNGACPDASVQSRYEGSTGQTSELQ